MISGDDFYEKCIFLDGFRQQDTFLGSKSGLHSTDLDFTGCKMISGAISSTWDGLEGPDPSISMSFVRFVDLETNLPKIDRNIDIYIYIYIYI